MERSSKTSQTNTKVAGASTSMIGDGIVATHKGLHSLMTDLLSTVKGLRAVQVEQAERIEALTKQVADQQLQITQLKKKTSRQGSTADSKGSVGHVDAPTPTTSTTGDHNNNNNNNNNSATDTDCIAMLRRELVGMIGTALAQHEEEMEALHHKVDNHLGRR